MIRILASLCILVAMLAVPAEAKRVALVIGNNSYSNQLPKFQLLKAVNDAEAMRAALTELGFDVTFRRDASLAEFKSAIFEFSGKVQKDDVAVFFYAGHGAALKGINYFLPSDIPKLELPDNPTESQIENKVSELAEFSIKESLVLQHIAKNEPRLSLVIMDACRDNPLRAESSENPFRTLTSDGVVLGDNIAVAEKTQPEGMIIVYSAAFGQTALDRLNNNDSHPNSPFTRAFVKNLKRQGLGIKQVVAETKEEVFRLAKSVNHKQTPAVYDQLFGGDLFLNGDSLKKSTGLPSNAVDRNTEAKQAFEAAGEDINMLRTVATEFADTSWGKLAAGKVKSQEKESAMLAKPDTSTSEQNLNPGDSFKDCEECPEMMVVPAGRFTMGSKESEEGRDADEGPTRRVSLAKPFAVGKFEITRGQLDAYVRETGIKIGTACHFFTDGNWDNAGVKNYRDLGFEQTNGHPAVCVSWLDARAYAEWLSKKTGQIYRLLTEAEWEYAARAGTQTRFVFGDISDDLCRFANGADKSAKSIPATSGWEFANCDDSSKFTAAVGSYKPNTFGLHDMHGNVWEWVEDCYEESYKNSSKNGSANKDRKGCDRVNRGGGWLNTPSYHRSANRSRASPTVRNLNIGFRLARAL